MKEILNAIFGWITGSPRAAVELLLVFGLVAGGWAYNRKTEQLANERARHGSLEDGLKQKITIKDGEIEELIREGDKVIVKRTYIPPEGHVVVRRKDQEKLQREYMELLEKIGSPMDESEREKWAKRIKDLLAKMNSPDEITVINKGFTFKPGMGFEIASRGMKPRLDFKWGFFRRYSGILGGSEYGVGVGVSRHLDDLLWFKPRNLEVFVDWKFLKFQADNPNGVVGFRVNF